MPGADLLDSTCLPSYQTVIWPVDLFTDCWMEWVLPSGEKFHDPRPMSLP